MDIRTCRYKPFGAVAELVGALLLCCLAATSVRAQEGNDPGKQPEAPAAESRAQDAQTPQAPAIPTTDAIPVTADTKTTNPSPQTPASNPQGTPPTEPDLKHSPATTPKSDPRYHIGPGDVLSIQVYNHTDLSKDQVRVDATGMIRMPLIPDVKAACLSESDLADQLAQQYSVYLRNPQVDVFVKEFSSEPVEVNGAVQKPGAFQLERRVRLRELLMIAGGTIPEAGPNIQILHDESALLCGNPTGSSPGDPEVQFVNYNDMVRGVGDNPYIQPGDFVNVPQANQAYVVGNVYKPTPVALNDPMTISRALALAGGVLPNSKSKIHLIRATPVGGTREIVLDLKTVQTQTTEDLTLMPGDIVEVPLSTLKLILKSVFVSFASAASIYYPLAYIK